MGIATRAAEPEITSKSERTGAQFKIQKEPKLSLKFRTGAQYKIQIRRWCYGPLRGSSGFLPRY